MAGEPLILTLELDAAAFSFFEALRQAHFPRDRNFLQAHLTLFHHLPDAEPAIPETLLRVAAETPVMDLQVSGVVSIGKGVAYKIESNRLQRVHKELQQDWRKWLLPQDRQKLWPHVTVQNKVAPQEAQELHAGLANSFEPFLAHGSALQLWVYKNGPWEMRERFPLAS